MCKKYIKWGIIAIVLIFLSIVYKKFNPNLVGYFPQCPFKAMTGLACPGCGSQRAVHYLLNFEIYKALGQNFLLIISIPYLLVGFAFGAIKTPGERVLKWRKVLFGKYAIFAILAIIISYWLARNIIN